MSREGGGRGLSAAATGPSEDAGPTSDPADVLPGPDQIPRRLGRHVRDRHHHDLPGMLQPGQVPGIAGVGLDPIPLGRNNFDGAAT